MSEGPKESPIRDVQWKGSDVIARAGGEIDLRSSTAFQKDLLNLVRKDPDTIVVDLKDVSYMDSSGVASLVKVLSRVRKSDGRLVLTSLSDRVRSIFEITRLDTVFEIVDSQEEALG